MSDKPIGTLDVGRIQDFVHGIREAQDQSLKELALVGAVFLGGNYLSHSWSSYSKRAK